MGVWILGGGGGGIFARGYPLSGILLTVAGTNLARCFPKCAWEGGSSCLRSKALPQGDCHLGEGGVQMVENPDPCAWAPGQLGGYLRVR